MSTTDRTPFTLADALVDDLADITPSAGTYWGVKGHDHRWEDLSPEGAATAAARLRRWKERFAALPEQTDRWSSLAVHVCLDQLGLSLDSIDHGDHLRDLNHLACPVQHVPMVFDAMDTATAEGWENVASRLEGVGGLFEGYRRSLQLGLDRGTPVAARQVRSVAAQCHAYAAEGASLDGLNQRLAQAGVGDEPLRARVAAATIAARDAYAALGTWLTESYLPHAAQADGVGRERYLRAVRHFLGSTPDPEATYAWGWEEIRAIQARMQASAERIAPGRPLREVVEMLMTDPAYGAPDRATFLALMQQRQQQALSVLEGVHFEVPEGIRRVDVKQAPAGGPPGAYYVPPSEDLSRPGTVFYSLTGEGPYALWDEVSTAYHEGFPGHHLQCALQVTLKQDLCRVHRVAYGYSGFAEGWALYAEELMSELGFYEKPEYELGMLANQMMRACRVVFDIGAHLDLPIPADAPFHPGERWTFELGVALMQEVGGMTAEVADSEIKRYLGWPGQAISYKVGQKVMLDLRREFLAAGGELPEFHRRVLACGNLSLDLLRDQVMES